MTQSLSASPHLFQLSPLLAVHRGSCCYCVLNRAPLLLLQAMAILLLQPITYLQIKLIKTKLTEEKYNFY